MGSYSFYKRETQFDVHQGEKEGIEVTREMRTVHKEREGRTRTVQQRTYVTHDRKREGGEALKSAT